MTSLQGGRSSVPKSGPEVIRTREEGRLSWRMCYQPNGTVVTQRHELHPGRVP